MPAIPTFPTIPADGRMVLHHQKITLIFSGQARQLQGQITVVLRHKVVLIY